MQTQPAPAEPELIVVRLLAQTRAVSPDVTRQALGACDPEALTLALRDQRLLGLLGSRALALWGADGAPRAFAEAVEEDLVANRSRGLALEALSARFVARLEEAGMPTLVLKGPLQARRLHGDVGYRMSNDVDLLVAKNHLGPAAVVLADFGYTLEPTPVRSHGLPDIHTVLKTATGGLPRIDLHWRIHWYEDEFSWRLLVGSRMEGAFRQPEPDDDLAALMLFYARDGFFGLRAPVDIAAWFGRYPVDEGPVLERHWQTYPGLRRAFTGAALATERAVGVPAGLLAPTPRRGGRAPRLAANLASWNQVGDLDQLRANVAVVDALLSPPRELHRFLRRELFVTGREIGSINRLPVSSRWRIAAMRPVHAAKAAVRQVVGFWSAVRPPRSRHIGERVSG